VNSEVSMTLDEAVAEVLGLLTGLDLRYDPRSDRYGVIARCLNRAVRDNALEYEWSHYANTEDMGRAIEGHRELFLRSSRRPRIISDDAVRLVRDDDQPVLWAYFLPRDALHKYANRPDLRVAMTRNSLLFSRPFTESEAGLNIQLTVMREPIMFRLPEQPEDPDEELVDIPTSVRTQLLDFDYPDVVISKAAYIYAQTDALMQPRVQTLEAAYKNLMYALIERDVRHTDTPLQNDFLLPISGSIYGESDPRTHGHPHADAWLEE